MKPLSNSSSLPGYPLSRQLGTSSSGSASNNNTGGTGGSNYGGAVDHLPSIYRLSKYLNGRHHYDEICTLFGISCKELDEILNTEPERIRLIHR